MAKTKLCWAIIDLVTAAHFYTPVRAKIGDFCKLCYHLFKQSKNDAG